MTRRRTSRRRTSRKLGSGSRFAALVRKLEARGDVADPRALAASIGRRKYGSRRFQQLAAAGRRRSSLRRNGFETQLLERLARHPKKPYPMQGLVPPGTPIDPKKTLDFVEKAISDGRLRDARFALNDYSRWRHHEGHAQPRGGDARASRLSMKIARLAWAEEAHR